MKKIFLILAITGVSTGSFAQRPNTHPKQADTHPQQADIHAQPEHPSAGETLTLSTDPGVDIRTVYRVLLNGEGIEMPARGGKYEQLSVTDSTAGFFLITHTGTDAVDQARSILCFPKGTTIPSKGAWYGFYNFVKTNPAELLIPDQDSLAFTWLDKEIQLYPASKAAHVAEYLFAMATFKKKAATATIIRELEMLGRKKDLSIDELLLLNNLYELYGQPAKAAQYAAILRDKYHDGRFKLEGIKLGSIEDEVYDRKLEYYKSMQVDQPALMVYHNAIGEYLKKNDFKHIDELIGDKPKDVWARTYFTVAFELLVQHKDPAMAAKYAKYDFETAKEAYDHPKEGDPFARYAKFNLGKGYELKAMQLARDGQFAAALPFYDSTKKYAALIPNDYADALYMQTMAHSDHYAEVKTKLEERMRRGADNPIINDALKTVWQHNPTTGGYNAYLSSFVTITNDSLKVHVSNTMINIPAPDFSLVDMQGNTVSLSSLKGKVVVIDFWATWCGPCVASFPKMDETREKYKDDDNVVFLFVDSWEAHTASRVKITEFLKDRNVPSLHALLDDEDKAITAYKVKGIPTKFIIDRNGNIRFNIVGNPPELDAILPEMSAMIEMVKKG